MAKRRLGIIAFLLCFCLCAMPRTVLAASTTDAKEQINTATECTLTINYSYDAVAFPGQTVTLYKVAEVSADFQYTLTASFADTGLVLNGIQTNGEWDVIRTTLDARCVASSIAPVSTAATDEAGNACFTALTPGLYLASAVHITEGAQSCTFDSALIALPGLGADGLWQYQVAVAAKPEILPDDEAELKVLKLWKGDEGRTDRPQSVEVEIFHNGTSYETVVLSEANHWSYSWTTTADGASWNVVEKNVPAGYTMTVATRENAFVITNTHNNHQDPPPSQTGDSSNILLYIIIMYISGTMLILLAIARKRNSHEKTN